MEEGTLSSTVPGTQTWAFVVGVVDNDVDTASLQHKLIEAWRGVSVLPANLVDELSAIINSSPPVRPEEHFVQDPRSRTMCANSQPSSRLKQPR